MSAHILPLRTYLAVFTALLVLTGVTTAVSYVDLGAFNNFVAMGIAITKGVLVVLIFMHLKWSSKLLWIFAASGIFWLLVLLAFTLTDIETRGATLLPWD